MSLNNRIERLKRQVEKLEPESNVRVFRNRMEYEGAIASNSVGRNDLCIIIAPKQSR